MFTVMTATAATGMKALEIVSYISVPLIVILGMYSMITATSEGGACRHLCPVCRRYHPDDRYWLCHRLLYLRRYRHPQLIRFAKNSKIAVWTPSSPFSWEIP